MHREQYDPKLHSVYNVWANAGGEQLDQNKSRSKLQSPTNRQFPDNQTYKGNKRCVMAVGLTLMIVVIVSAASLALHFTFDVFGMRCKAVITMATTQASDKPADPNITNISGETGRTKKLRSTTPAKIVTTLPTGTSEEQTAAHSSPTDAKTFASSDQSTDHNTINILTHDPVFMNDSEVNVTGD